MPVAQGAQKLKLKGKWSIRFGRAWQAQVPQIAELAFLLQPKAAVVFFTRLSRRSRGSLGRRGWSWGPIEDGFKNGSARAYVFKTLLLGCLINLVNMLSPWL